MKLKKWEFLLAYVYYINQHGHVFTVAAHGDYAVSIGISRSKAGLMAMLSECKAKKLMINDADSCWFLTDAGEVIANALWIKIKYDFRLSNIIANKLKPTSDEVLNDAQSNNNEFVQELKDLRESNVSLKNELNAANAKVMNIKKQLLDAYDLLDKKTKECDRLMLGLERMSNECKNMASWAISIKNGQG